MIAATPGFRGSWFTGATQYTPALALPPRVDHEPLVLE